MSSNRFIKIAVDKGVKYFNLAQITSITLNNNQLIFEYPVETFNGTFLFGSGAMSSYKEPYILTYLTKEDAEKALKEVENKLI